MSCIDIVQSIFGPDLRDDTSFEVAKGSNRRFTVSADISAPSLDARTSKELSGTADPRRRPAELAARPGQS
nr:hypothetical protein SHINE37_70120 [Rhizobiaceae bacterium]